MIVLRLLELGFGGVVLDGYVFILLDKLDFGGFVVGVLLTLFVVCLSVGACICLLGVCEF